MMNENTNLIDAAEGAAILIKAAGPIVISSKCVITKADGTVDIKEKTSLCGCGASANKPYCDGSHKNVSINQL